MTFTLRVNTRNDLHLPSELLHHINLGEDRILKVEAREGKLILIPVDLEPRYSHEELAGLDRIHEDEKKKGWTRLVNPKDIDQLLKQKMKHLAFSKHFHRQLKKLSIQDQEKIAKKLKDFLLFLPKSRIPIGFGFKKINGDKYEIRVDIKLRIIMKLESDTLVCHVVGNHEEVKRYLKEYRNK